MFLRKPLKTPIFPPSPYIILIYLLANNTFHSNYYLHSVIPRRAYLLQYSYHLLPSNYVLIFIAMRLLCISKQPHLSLLYALHTLYTLYFTCPRCSSRHSPFLTYKRVLSVHFLIIRVPHSTSLVLP